MKSYEEQINEMLLKLFGGEPDPLPERIVSAYENDKFRKAEDREQLRDSWKKKKRFPRRR